MTRHACRYSPICNSTTGAIHGFLKAINKIIEDFDPKNIGVVFDAKGKNFRHKIYTEYKANRSSMPEELVILHNMYIFWCWIDYLSN